MRFCNLQENMSELDSYVHQLQILQKEWNAAIEGLHSRLQWDLSHLDHVFLWVVKLSPSVV